MSASMEVLGIGGHEKFAEEIFAKVKEGTIKIVEVTKAQYDALTPEQKADPTKLYLVPGSGGYLKFVEISDEDYEALTEEQKMDPTTVYLTPGEGTYFRVVDISQEDYDALTPEEKADPQVLYLIVDETEYLTKAEADETYAAKGDLSSYLTSEAAAATYATKNDISGLESSSHASSTYLSKSDAASTYATKSEAQYVSKNESASGSVNISDGVADALLNKCVIHLKPDQDYSSSPPSPDNIRLINGHDQSRIRIGASLNDPNYKTYTATYIKVIAAVRAAYPDFETGNLGNNVIFGGDYDAINGTFTVTKIKYCFTGNETLTQGDVYDYPQLHYKPYRLTFPSMIFTASESENDMICTHYESWDGSSWNLGHNDLWCRIRNMNDYAEEACIFEWRNDDVASINAMKTYLAEQYDAGTPVAFVATLTTPIVVDGLDKLQIRTLEGHNTIWLYLDDTSVLDIDYITPSISGIIKNVENEILPKVVVNLTWDSTNGCYVSDKPLIALPGLDENAVQNLMIDKGYDAELRIVETTEPSTGMIVDNQRTMHLYLSHRVGSNMSSSYMQFYIPQNKAGGGIEFIKYKAQYDSTYDSGSVCTHIFPDNT